MNKGIPALKRALGLALLVAVSAAYPGLTANAQPRQDSSGLTHFQYLPIIDPPADAIPPQTPEQIAYTNLHDEIYGQLTAYFNNAAVYRNEYLTFMYSQQLLGRDTTTLQAILDNFDSYVTQGKAGLTAAQNAISGDPGLDTSGNVTGADLYNSSIKAALDNDWVARGNLNQAVYQLHSGLLQYQYIWGTNAGIPDIPKWHLTPYQLPS
jgi:hypothetical protein